MSDDIVTRLRNEVCYAPECVWLFSDAADEIERLRAERDRWTQCAERLAEWETREHLLSAMDLYYENIRLDMKAEPGE